MICSVDELRNFIKSEETDAMLDSRLKAIESQIRSYTGNNFQIRSIRTSGTCISGVNAVECSTSIPVKSGDTIQISGSKLNSGLYVISEVKENVLTVKEDLLDEVDVCITKVSYPADVKMGAVNMLKWDLKNRDKAGIQSETLSRHTVTYADMSGENSKLGYPKSLVGFLKPYMRARF